MGKAKASNGVSQKVRPMEPTVLNGVSDLLRPWGFFWEGKGDGWWLGGV